MIVRLNKTGMIFGAVYLAGFCSLLGSPSRLLTPRAPIFSDRCRFCPLSFLWSSGLAQFLESHVASDSWLDSWFFTGPVSLLIVYLSVGIWALSGDQVAGRRRRTMTVTATRTNPKKVAFSPAYGSRLTRA